MIQCSTCGASTVKMNSLDHCSICGSSLAKKTFSNAKNPNSTSNPWAEAEKTGIIKAFFLTTIQILFKPSQFFADLIKFEPNGQFNAWLYAMVASSLGIIFNLIWQNYLSGIPDINFYAGFTENFSNSTLNSLLFAPLILSSNLFICSAYIHIVLTLTNRQKRNFKATFMVFSYLHSIAIFSIIPFIGKLITPLWAAYLLIVGLSKVHKIGKIQSLMTILYPLIIFFVIIFFMAMLFFALGILGEMILKDLFPIIR